MDSEHVCKRGQTGSGWSMAGCPEAVRFAACLDHGSPRVAPGLFAPQLCEVPKPQFNSSPFRGRLVLLGLIA
jgi:hypothetical protein